MEWMAHNAAFSPPTGADIDAVVLGETRQWICAKADKAWKATQELVYNHQLCYDGQLAAFTGETERTLQEKWGEISECICQLMGMEGVSHYVCLGLALQVLNKLSIIPIYLTFSMQIPMEMGYCPKTCIYQTGTQTREELPHSRRSSKLPTSYPRSSSGLPMKERWMTAVQRECPLWLTQWLGDIHRLGPTPNQKAPPAAIVHPHPAQGRAHTRLPENQHISHHQG